MKSTLVSNCQLKDKIEKVKEIIALSSENSAPPVRNYISSLLEGGGKMLRPSFVILASEFGNNDRDRILNIAAAVEMLHMASLVHDDIIDNSDTRRNRPTAMKLFGSRISVLLGDYIFSKSFALLAENSISENRETSALLMSRICDGEIRQNSSRFSDDFSMRSYRRRITAKTALLFMISLYLGASESSCSSSLLSLFKRIGYNIGMSFQITDDILDYTGSEKTTGKPAGNDLKEGIYTAPFLHSLDTENRELRRLLKRKPWSNSQRKKIIKLVEETGGIDEARKTASIYTERALREIDRLPECASKNTLRKITESLLIRSY